MPGAVAALSGFGDDAGEMQDDSVGFVHGNQFRLLIPKHWTCQKLVWGLRETLRRNRGDFRAMQEPTLGPFKHAESAPAARYPVAGAAEQPRERSPSDCDASGRTAPEGRILLPVRERICRHSLTPWCAIMAHLLPSADTPADSRECGRKRGRRTQDRRSPVDPFKHPNANTCRLPAESSSFRRTFTGLIHFDSFQFGLIALCRPPLT